MRHVIHETQVFMSVPSELIVDILHHLKANGLELEKLYIDGFQPETFTIRGAKSKDIKYEDIHARQVFGAPSQDQVVRQSDQ